VDVDMGLLLESGHLLGGILLFSGIVMSLWLKIAADKSANTVVMAFSQRQILWVGSGVIFSGVGLLVFTGILRSDDNYLQLPWLVWGIGLFVLSGVIWVLFILPLHLKQYTQIRQVSALTALPKTYKNRDRLWYSLTIFALVLHLLIAYLMIYKPYQLPLL